MSSPQDRQGNGPGWRDFARLENDLREIRDANIPAKLAVLEERMGNLQSATMGVKRLLYGLIGVVLAGIIMLAVTQLITP